MKSLLTILFLAVFLSLNAQESNGEYSWENKYLVRGETLKYKIKYGWFKIGQAEMYHDKTFHEIDGEPHYLVQFKLKTVGWLRIFANVDLRFESYVNAKTFLPHHATRIIMNGKKSNIQYDKFQYSDSIYVETYRQERQQTRISTFPVGDPTFSDALGTYLYARGQDLEMDKSETIRFYIANRIYQFTMEPDSDLGKKGQKGYELVFPPIKEFPRDKTSYAILDVETNTPLEIKLSTDNGNFFLILDN